MVDEADVPGVLNEVLKLPGMTQALLAKHADVSQGTISKWRTTGHSPNKKKWDQLLRFIRQDHRMRKMLSKRPLTDDDFSIDEMVKDDSPEIRQGVRRLVEIYLQGVRTRE